MHSFETYGGNQNFYGEMIKGNSNVVYVRPIIAPPNHLFRSKVVSPLEKNNLADALVCVVSCSESLQRYGMVRVLGFQERNKTVC